MIKSESTQFSATEVDTDTLVLSITDSARRELVASSTSFIHQVGRAAAHLSVLLTDGSATIVCKMK